MKYPNRLNRKHSNREVLKEEKMVQEAVFLDDFEDMPISESEEPFYEDDAEPLYEAFYDYEDNFDPVIDAAIGHALDKLEEEYPEYDWEEADGYDPEGAAVDYMHDHGKLDGQDFIYGEDEELISYLLDNHLIGPKGIKAEGLKESYDDEDDDDLELESSILEVLDWIEDDYPEYNWERSKGYNPERSAFNCIKDMIEFDDVSIASLDYGEIISSLVDSGDLKLRK